MQKPPRLPRGKRSELIAWLARSNVQQVGEIEWAALLQELAPVSVTYLRRLLRENAEEAGVMLSPMIEGVRQDTFDNLQRTLIALQGEYLPANPERRKEIRKLVIEGKDHARLAAKKFGVGAEDKLAQKQEMQLWMLTWLENPTLFSQWVFLRRLQLGHSFDVRQET
jgi:hypothetical protein